MWARAHRETETVAVLECGGRLLARHRLHRGGGEVAAAVEFTAVEQHPGETRDIGGRRKQSARRNREARAVGQRIAELIVGRFLEIGFRGVGFIDLRHAADLRLGRPECRFLHAKRLEQPRAHEVLVGQAAHDLDDARCGVDARVAVEIFAARLP